jgi:hypothetical protein
MYLYLQARENCQRLLNADCFFSYDEEKRCIAAETVLKEAEDKELKAFFTNLTNEQLQTMFVWSICDPLHIAANCGYIETLKYLVHDRGMDANAINNTGVSPLHSCINNSAIGPNLEVLHFFISEGHCPESALRLMQNYESSQVHS